MSPTSLDPPVEDAPNAREIVSYILENSDQARLMEVFYIAREPGVLEALRWLTALPEHGRQQLNEFIGGSKKADVYFERPEPAKLVITVLRR